MKTMPRNPIYGEVQTKRSVRATDAHWKALQAMATARGYRGLSPMLAAIATGELLLIEASAVETEVPQD